MKTRHTYGLAVALTCIGSISPALAQQSTLPEVEVQQKKAAAAKAKAAKKVQAPAAVQQPTQEPVEQAPIEEASPLDNSPYGSSASSGAQQRAATSVTSPVNPSSIVPQNLEKFSGAATIINAKKLEENQPRNINEALTRVPGVIVVNDDGNGHHGGIGVRGSPPRRARKILVMEDGHPANLALWLDPSVHYVAPIERLEGIEVIRGTIIAHGPNNNYGVVNYRNLSPFGAEETVISSAIGFTKNKTG